MKIEFANRLKELNTLYTSDATRIIIDAPAGYGKTSFLIAAKERMESGIEDSTGKITQWKSAYVDIKLDQFHNKRAIANIRNEIAQKIADNPKASVGSNNELEVVLGKALTDSGKRLLLIFDSAEQIAEPERLELRRLIRDLCETFGIDRIKVIVAERYSINEHRRSVIDGQLRFPLQPFTEGTVVEILKSIEKSSHHDQHTYEAWARGIIRLSGGHPQAIVNLVTELAESGWPINYPRAEREAELYKRHVADEVKKLLTGIEESISKGLKVVSIFRFFTLTTIQYLQSLNKIQVQDPLSFTKLLLDTGLVKREGFAYSDAIVRDLLLVEMKVEFPDLYKDFHKLAWELYNKLISGTVKDEEAGTKVPIYVREGVYHLSQFSTETDRGPIAEAFKNYAESLKQAGYESDEDCREELEKIIERECGIASEFDQGRRSSPEQKLIAGVFFEVKRFLFKIETKDAREAETTTKAQTAEDHSKHRKVKVLFLAANPEGTTRLKLDSEVRAIEQKVRASKYRDSFELITGLAAQSQDLIQLLSQHQPDILHFSGHGTEKGELLFNDDLGNPKPIAPKLIGDLLSRMHNHLRIVLLNACYTSALAKAITKSIDFAVGTNLDVDDDAAIRFAATFYGALGFGHSVERAFSEGRIAAGFELKGQEKALVLLSREGVDAAQIHLVTS